MRQSKHGKTGRKQQSDYIVWGALLATIVVYGFVCSKAAQAPAGFVKDSQMVNTLQMVFGAISLVEAALIPVIKRMFLGDFLKEIGKGHPETPDFLEKTFIPQVIGWAICESIAIFGFVLAVIARDFNLYLPFGVAAFLLILYHRPLRP